MAKDIEEPSLATLIDGWLHQALGSFIAALLSLALITGSGYLLFTAPSDQNHIDQEILDYGTLTADEAQATQMTKIVNAGWTSNLDNLTRIDDIQKTLNASDPARPLDPAFARQTLTWCTNSLIQLADEEGQVKGFVFKDPLMQKAQANDVQQYEVSAQLLQQYSGMISDWTTESVQDKKKRQDAIVTLLLQLKEANSEVKQTDQQLLSQVATKSRQNEIQHQAIQTDIQTLTRKVIAASAGLVLGIVVLGSYIYQKATRRRAPAPVTPPPVKKNAQPPQKQNRRRR